METIDYSLV